MKKNKLTVIISLIIFGVFLISCDPPPSENENETVSEEVLEEQSDSFDKSMEDVNDAMDKAKVLNEKIQIVEAQFKSGRINREKADQLIKDLNSRYSRTISENDEQSAAEEFPMWLKDLYISEPEGLTLNMTDSYSTDERDLSDGYNSVLYVYNGSYEKAMAEAKRIARAANIPLSEPYQKAKDLADQLGKKIEGIDGVTYLNYKFGDSDFKGKYKISLSVDKNGKFAIHVVDEQMKKARKKSTSLPRI
jgi:hypothetical protein